MATTTVEHVTIYLKYDFKKVFSSCHSTGINCKFQKISLPALNMWDRAIDKSFYQRDKLDVLVKRNRGFFCGQVLDQGQRNCVISRAGHLIIYTNEYNRQGYALSLKRAVSICVNVHKKSGMDGKKEEIVQVT